MRGRLEELQLSVSTLRSDAAAAHKEAASHAAAAAEAGDLRQRLSTVQKHADDATAAAREAEDTGRGTVRVAEDSARVAEVKAAEAEAKAAAADRRCEDLEARVRAEVEAGAYTLSHFRSN